MDSRIKNKDDFKKRLYSFLEGHTPPGADYKKGLVMICLFLFLAIAFAFLIFLGYFGAAKESLYYWRQYDEKVLREGAVMRDFGSLLGGFFSFFGYSMGCLGLGFGYWRSFRTESQSIYLMKRLKKDEVLKRSFSLPLLAMLAASLSAILLLNICGAIYLNFTPAPALPQHIELGLFDMFLFIKR